MVEPSIDPPAHVEKQEVKERREHDGYYQKTEPNKESNTLPAETTERPARRIISSVVRIEIYAILSR